MSRVPSGQSGSDLRLSAAFVEYLLSEVLSRIPESDNNTLNDRGQSNITALALLDIVLRILPNQQGKFNYSARSFVAKVAPPLSDSKVCFKFTRDNFLASSDHLLELFGPVAFREGDRLLSTSFNLGYDLNETALPKSAGDLTTFSGESGHLGWARAEEFISTIDKQINPTGTTPTGESAEKSSSLVPPKPTEEEQEEEVTEELNQPQEQPSTSTASRT